MLRFAPLARKNENITFYMSNFEHWRQPRRADLILQITLHPPGGVGGPDPVGDKMGSGQLGVAPPGRRRPLTWAPL